jgi:glutathione reductase (NADPH)
VPKKLMSYGAHFADWLRLASNYGWELGAARHDFAKLLRNRNDEIARLNGIYIGMLEKAGVRLIAGRARIVGRSGDGFVVEVGGERIAATRVALAVGAQPSAPVIPGVELAVSSDQLLEDVYELPRRLAVIGAGYIGLEQSSIFLGLGVETHLLLRRQLPLHGFDDDLRHGLKTALERRGMNFRCEMEIQAIERTEGALRVVTSTGAVEVDQVLLATGRRPMPNTRGIGLEELGVRMDDAGAVLVDRDYASNVPGLHALGDCSDHAFGCEGGTAAEELGLGSGEFDLTPVAVAEGRALAERLFNDPTARVNYHAIPTAVFSIPQAASVGLAEARARRLGHDVQVFMTTFRPLLYTMPDDGGARGEDRTTMKLVVDRETDKVLGCHMVGDDAAEIVQALAVALTCGATKAQFDDTMALHPTSAEEFVTLYQPVA